MGGSGGAGVEHQVRVESEGEGWRVRAGQRWSIR